MNRTQIINELIASNSFESYLEIGIGNGSNFKSVKCENKIGVDPEKGLNVAEVFKVTSDKFFEQSEEKFDLIFIDGLHHADQVEKDIVNSWNALNTGGMILIHDVKPEDEAMTEVPRKQKIWTGDVFRAWYGLNETYPKLKTDYIEEQWGIGVIQKSRHKIEPGFVSDINFTDYYHNIAWVPFEG